MCCILAVIKTKETIETSQDIYSYTHQAELSCFYPSIAFT